MGFPFGICYHPHRFDICISYFWSGPEISDQKTSMLYYHGGAGTSSQIPGQWFCTKLFGFLQLCDLKVNERKVLPLHRYLF